jgi:predicted MPP superfamily phosphohydrolase
VLVELAGAAAGALAVWSGWIEPRSLRVRRFSVAMPGLSAPVRAVAIGDLQPWRIHWPARRLRAAFARAAAEKPDIVFWLGDYYNAPTRRLTKLLTALPALRRPYDAMQTPLHEIVAEMGRLTAPMGAWAVLGNHDWHTPGEAVIDALRGVGITPLVGEAAWAEHRETGARLRVIGLDDPSSRRPHGWERIGAEDGPAVMLVHAPDVWDDIPDAPALTLAGHTHGGQIAPLGPLFLPELGERYARGWHDRDGRRLYVTRGLGASILPLRLNAPPEIVTLDLTPA